MRYAILLLALAAELAAQGFKSLPATLLYSNGTPSGGCGAGGIGVLNLDYTNKILYQCDGDSWEPITGATGDPYGYQQLSGSSPWTITHNLNLDHGCPKITHYNSDDEETDLVYAVRVDADSCQLISSADLEDDWVVWSRGGGGGGGGSADDLGSGDPGANGLMARTALNTTSARTITGTSNEISVTNGNGVSGNPTLALPSTIDLSGKTVELPNSGSLPGSCTNDGEIYVHTAATAGRQLYVCDGGTYVLQGDGNDGSAELEAEEGIDATALASGIVKVNTATVPTFLTNTASLDFDAVDADCEEKTMTLSGAAELDSVIPGWPATINAGIRGIMFVSAANTITVRLCRDTGSTNMSALNFRATIVRSF